MIMNIIEESPCYSLPGKCFSCLIQLIEGLIDRPTLKVFSHHINGVDIDSMILLSLTAQLRVVFLRKNWHHLGKPN